jgi:hypothetical protein
MLKADSNRDGQDRQDEGKRKKEKGKNENRRNGHSALIFTLCLSFILFILSIPVNFFL